MCNLIKKKKALKNTLLKVVLKKRRPFNNRNRHENNAALCYEEHKPCGNSTLEILVTQIIYVS